MKFQRTNKNEAPVAEPTAVSLDAVIIGEQSLKLYQNVELSTRRGALSLVD